MALLNESSRSWLPHEADHDILLRISRRDIVDDEWGSFVTAVCSTVLIVSMVSTFYWVFWKPYSKRRFYEKQGISGPVFRPFIGNLPEIRELRRGVPKLGGQISESPRDLGTTSVTIAPGTNVIIPMSVLNQSKEIWGQDAHLFKPDRWEVKNLHTNGKNSAADGLNAATAAAANSVNSFNNFMPFGGGNRICLGRNLARMTVKLLLAMLLRRFSFSVSPSYCHAPGRGGNNLWPKFGIQILIKNVENSEFTSTN